MKSTLATTLKHMEMTSALHQSAPNTRIRTAARILTGLLTFIWVFFGIQYFIDPETTRVIVGQLGYPLYVVPLIGVTHILGGLGLQIPNSPKLTEWVYAGLTIDLLLAAVSHIASHDAFTNTLHPLGLLVFLLASYVLRNRINGPLWGN